MKTIVHVGDMKAGSKSIQTFVNANQGLLQESGILVSRATRRGPYHSMLASYALDDTRLARNPRREWGITDRNQLADHRAEVERRIADELAQTGPGIHTMLFSHEGLLSLDAPEVNRLTALLRRHFSEIRIVAYIRRQDRHLVSRWGQQIKAGRVPPTKFYTSFRDNETYLEKLGNWERAAGPGNLSVRVFESKAFLKGCLHRDFCAAAGIPWNPEFVQPKPANIGIDRVAQTFLQSLNACLQTKKGGAAVRFLERYFTGRGIMPPRAWARKVVKYFAPENEEIRRRYFPDRPVLFDDDFSSFPSKGSADCTAQEAFDLAVTMWRHFRRELSETEIQQAYRLVLGRKATPEEIAQHAHGDASIRSLYVRLLKSEEYRESQQPTTGTTHKNAA